MKVYTERFISLRGRALFYYRTGSGPVPLLVFHGFGQTHKAFDPWIARLGEKYTLILVDLYFHGKSTWSDAEHALEKDFWKQVVGLIMEQENIDSFSLAGYSLGGKFALAALESFPTSVKELYLIAPDGVRPNFWYSLATWPMPMRRLFRSLIHHERRFTRLIAIARRLRLADRGVLRFAGNQMDTEGKRARVYNTWVVFRHLRFDMYEVFGLINQFGIPVVVIVGRYDRIVPAHALRRPLNRLKNMSFHVVDTGHNDLIVAAIPFLAR